MLERLTQPVASAEPRVATPKPEKTVDLDKLEELTKPVEPTPAEGKPAEAARAADLEKANEKLSSLLGKPK